jgi:hypothetical protein
LKIDHSCDQAIEAEGNKRVPAGEGVGGGLRSEERIRAQAVKGEFQNSIEDARPHHGDE